MIVTRNLIAMQTRIPTLLAAICALATSNLHADASADEAWKKVEAAMKNVKDPQPKPTTKEEALEYFTKAVAAYDAAAKDFYGKAATDPRRWEAKYFELETAPLFGVVSDKAPASPETLADEILAASDAPDKVKAGTTGMKLLFGMERMKATPEREAAWVKDATAFIKQYPDSEHTRMLQTRLNYISTMAGLKNHPLELKFTAVDGRKVDLSKLRGKVVLVDFWATWCPPCVAELPHLLETYQKYHSKGFEIIGISLDEDKSELEAFVKEHGMAWPQHFDGKAWESALVGKFGVAELPTMWLVDKKGMLITSNAEGRLEELVEKHLAAE